MKKFFSHFMTALAGLSSLTTLVSFAYYWNTQKFSLCASVIIGSVILLICIGYAIWQIVPKNSLSLTINEILKVNIKVGDLFTYRNHLVVIPVNEYFDTLVDNKIIAKSSIHGQFITKYFTDSNEAQESIQNELKIFPDSQFTIGQRSHELPQRKYKLGTAISIIQDDIKFLLVAFTHFDNNNCAYLDNNEIRSVINQLYSAVRSHANGLPVVMPVLGTGLAKIAITPKKMLQYLLLNLEISMPDKRPTEINFIIYSKDKNKYNLSQLEDLYK